MNSKLTLSIEPEIIEVAKDYAKLKGRSLSNIVSEYLKSLSIKKSKSKKQELSKIVRELKGSVVLKDPSKNYKDLIEEALIEKYL